MSADRTGRRAQACESCRRQKLACRVDFDEEGAVCERCKRLDRVCIPHVPKPHGNRNRREHVARQSRTPKAPDEVLSTTEPSTSQAQRTPGSATAETIGERLHRNFAKIRDNDNLSALDVLTDEKAEDHLQQYRLLSRTWPFVIIGEELRASTLIDNEPLLFLAVLVVTSSSGGNTQGGWASLFREALASRVIAIGDRSLAILQSLLIFLAWHHQYLRHSKQQIYQMLQLAVGMTVDLGLCDDRFIGEQRLSQDLTSELVIRGTTESCRTTEGKRALLGCYYLSFGYSVLGFNKPQTLTCWDFLSQCANELAAVCLFPNDLYFPHMVEVFRLTEDIATVQSTYRGSSPSLLQDAMLDRLRKAKRSSNGLGDSQNPHWLKSSYLFAFINLFNGHHMTPISDQSITARTSNLLSMVEATNTFLDFFVQARAQDFADLAILEWFQLCGAIIYMSKSIEELRRGVDGQNNIAEQELQALVEKAVKWISVIREHTYASKAGVSVTRFTWFRAVLDKLKARLQKISSSSGEMAGISQISTFEDPRGTKLGAQSDVSTAPSSTIPEDAATSGLNYTAFDPVALQDIDFSGLMDPLMDWVWS